MVSLDYIGEVGSGQYSTSSRVWPNSLKLSSNSVSPLSQGKNGRKHERKATETSTSNTPSFSFQREKIVKPPRYSCMTSESMYCPIAVRQGSGGHSMLRQALSRSQREDCGCGGLSSPRRRYNSEGTGTTMMEGVANEFEQATREAFAPLVMRTTSDQTLTSKLTASSRPGSKHRRRRTSLGRNRTKYNLLHYREEPRQRSNSGGNYSSDSYIQATNAHRHHHDGTTSFDYDSDSGVAYSFPGGTAGLQQDTTKEIAWLRCSNCEKNFPGIFDQHATPGFSSLIFCSGECRFSLVFRENVRRRRQEIIEKEVIAAKYRIRAMRSRSTSSNTTSSDSSGAGSSRSNESGQVLAHQYDE